MIKTIFFDLDDTIFDFHKAEAVAVSKTLAEQGVDNSKQTVARYSEINASMWKRLEKGELSREEVLVKRFEQLFLELGVEDCDAFDTRKKYEKNLSVGHYFVDGAYELLEKLSKKYDLYLVSNGTYKVQEGRLNSSGIKKFFKGIFISEKLGFVKPQKEFFDEVFSKIQNFDKQSAIIVGDSLSSDIKGGNNAGIKTCWFNPKHLQNQTDAKVDYEIHSLTEIYKIL